MSKNKGNLALRENSLASAILTMVSTTACKAEETTTG